MSATAVKTGTLMIALTPDGVASLETYDAVERPAREAYDAVRRQAREAYDAVERPAWEAYDAVKRQAWEALASSPDPLVAWVGTNVGDWMDETLDLLRSAIDGPIDADAYASRQGWCGEWQDLRAAAIAAGVVTVSA